MKNDTDLALLVDRFMRRIHEGLQSQGPGFDRMAVGPGGGVILMTLKEMGRTTVSELTKRVARDKSQMTRSIQSLEKKGLILREPSEKDRRVSLVSLTMDGEKVVGELMETVSEVVGAILDPLSETETQLLKDLLRRALP